MQCKEFAGVILGHTVAETYFREIAEQSKLLKISACALNGIIKTERRRITLSNFLDWNYGIWY